MLFVERRNQSLEEMFLNLYAIVADEKACLYVLLVFQMEGVCTHGMLGSLELLFIGNWSR